MQEFETVESLELPDSIEIMYVTVPAWFFVSHRLVLAEMAVHKGWDVHVVAKPDDKVGEILAAGCAFHEWEVARGFGGIAQELRSFFKLFNIFRKNKPKIVHLVGMKSILYGGIAARLLGIECVVAAVSGRGEIYAGKSLFKRFIRYLSDRLLIYIFSHPCCSAIFQNNDDSQYFILGNILQHTKRALIKGSGVDLTLFNENPKAREGFVCLLASRMLWQKGVADYVCVADKLNAEGCDITFLLAGKYDPESPSFIPLEQLEGWNKRGSVKWLGHAENMSELISGCDIVVLPTVYGEGVPKILLEACASGKPIVASDWPGCREAVDHEINGFLFEPGNLESLASAIRLLSTDRAMCSKMGKAGRLKAVNEFSVEKVVYQTFQVYCELIRRHEERVV